MIEKIMLMVLGILMAFFSGVGFGKEDDMENGNGFAIVSGIIVSVIVLSMAIFSQTLR